MGGLRNILRNPYAILLLIFLVLCPVLLTPYIHSNDPVGYYSYLRSAVIDKDMDLANEYAYYKSQFHELSVPRSAIGKVNNRFTIGAALMWGPFFITAHAAVHLLNSIGFSIPADGYSFPYVLATTFASSLYGLFGLMIIFSLLRNWFSKFTSMLTVLLIWFATPVVFYMFFQASSAHVTSMFTVAAFVWFWYNSRGRSTSQWFALGLLGGLMTLVRPTNGLFMIIPLLESVLQYKDLFVDRKWNHFATLFKQNMVFLLGLIIVLTPQLLVYQAINGSIFSGAEAAAFEPSSLTQPIYFFKILFAHHGLFSWTPIFIFAVIGLFFFLPKKDKKTAWFCIIAFCMILYLLSTWRGWFGGAAFGQRKFLGSLVFLALGLGAFVDFLEKKLPKPLIALLGLGFITWNLGLLIQFGSRMIPAADPVALKEIAYNNFVEVPKKFFGILKTFLFERGSYLKR